MGETRPVAGDSLIPFSFRYDTPSGLFVFGFQQREPLGCPTKSFVSCSPRSYVVHDVSTFNIN